MTAPMAGNGQPVDERDTILEVRNLKKYFPITAGFILQRRVADIKAVDDVSFFVKRGETLGLVGESGSGKTTVGRSILQLEKPTAGEVVFEGTDITKVGRDQLRTIRRRMQIIFQDPYSSLNPRMKVLDIVGEALTIHRLVKNKREYRLRVGELLQQVGLNPDMANRYPHEFSGGQRQRIGVARALAVEPEFIVADEPVSALDVSIQAQLINLLEGPAAGAGALVPDDRPRPGHRAARVGPDRGDVPGEADGSGLVDEPVRERAAPVHEGAAVGGAHPGPGPRAGA